MVTEGVLWLIVCGYGVVGFGFDLVVVLRFGVVWWRWGFRFSGGLLLFMLVRQLLCCGVGLC